MRVPVILIFDVGKTNKKVLLFDKQYKLLYEECKQFPETKDEDHFPCEDVHLLTAWVNDAYRCIIADERFEVTAINVSAYGASFVHLDENKKPFLPLYNYLKPHNDDLQQQFYKLYGGKDQFAKETASPVLGNLNSGMQLYSLKLGKPDMYAKISFSCICPNTLSLY